MTGDRVIEAGGPMRDPLAHRAPELGRLASLTDGAVRARELPGRTQISLRCAPALLDRLPFALPVEPNTSTADALWLGPDEWLVVVEDEVGTRLAQIRDALDGTHHTAVDVSANRAIVELFGDRRHTLLASRCPIDLHPRAWGPGRCAQTLVGRVPVLLEERDDATRVFVRPSFGGTFVDLLVDAAAIALRT